jgi:hypothetical protein
MVLAVQPHCLTTMSTQNRAQGFIRTESAIASARRARVRHGGSDNFQYLRFQIILLVRWSSGHTVKTMLRAAVVVSRVGIRRRRRQLTARHVSFFILRPGLGRTSFRRPAGLVLRWLDRSGIRNRRGVRRETALGCSGKLPGVRSLLRQGLHYSRVGTAFQWRIQG